MLGKSGKATYARAFGMADLEAAKPAMIDTVYDVASISKWLTAATVLKLVEAGKLSLDAPITTWTCSPTSCLGRSRRPRPSGRFPEAREHVILATKSG